MLFSHNFRFSKNAFFLKKNLSEPWGTFVIKNANPNKFTNHG